MRVFDDGLIIVIGLLAITYFVVIPACQQSAQILNPTTSTQIQTP